MTKSNKILIVSSFVFSTWAFSNDKVDALKSENSQSRERQHEGVKQKIEETHNQNKNLRSGLLEGQSNNLKAMAEEIRNAKTPEEKSSIREKYKNKMVEERKNTRTEIQENKQEARNEISEIRKKERSVRMENKKEVHKQLKPQRKR